MQTQIFEMWVYRGLLPSWGAEQRFSVIAAPWVEEL